jgi:hypothetical protein
MPPSRVGEKIWKPLLIFGFAKIFALQHGFYVSASKHYAKMAFAYPTPPKWW